MMLRVRAPATLTNSRVHHHLCFLSFRWTLATSLKYCMAGKAPVEALAPYMESFLVMLRDEDLDIKKAALLMVNAAVHHQVWVSSLKLV